MTASSRRALGILAGVAAINATVFSPLGDEWFFAIVFFGALLTGVVTGLRHGDTAAAAAAWFASGIVWLILDWAINQEDRLFHIVLAFLMAGLVALGARAGRMLGRVRPAS